MTLSSKHSTSGEDNESDSHGVILYLHCPGAQVVLLQAYFDLYEGIGIVRTLDIRKSLICILTTTSMLDDCKRVLESLKDQIDWAYAETPTGELKDKYLGYGKKGL